MFTYYSHLQVSTHCSTHFNRKVRLHHKDHLADGDFLVVDRWPAPFAGPSFQELPDDGGLAALVEQRDSAVQALRLRWADVVVTGLPVPIPEILTVGEALPEYDVGEFSYAEESTDRGVLITFAVVDDVSLGRQSLDFSETCEHPIDV